MVLGGGQDAMNVTMTDRRAGKFEAKFDHKVISFPANKVSSYCSFCVTSLLTLYAYNI